MAGTIVTLIFSALLSLSLCLDQRRMPPEDRLFGPSLRIENGSLVPREGSVTFRCQGSWEASEYYLMKDQKSRRMTIKNVTSSAREGEIYIPSVKAEDAGTYYCVYKLPAGCSWPSAPLKFVVTGIYKPPTLAVLLSSQEASGHNVILQCQSQLWHDSSVLYKGEKQITSTKVQHHAKGSQANFFNPVVRDLEGTYQCYMFHSRLPTQWSSPSNPLMLKVTDTAKAPHLIQSPGDPPNLTASPPNPAPQDYTVGNLICLSLAGLVLIILGVLLAEAWYSQRGTQEGAAASPDRGEHRTGINLTVCIPKTQSTLPAPGTTMTHLLSVLLCLGLCLDQRMRTQADRLPKPSLWADKDPLVPLGRSVMLGCQGSWGAEMYRLEKKQGSERRVIKDMTTSGKEVKFLIHYVTVNDTGTYFCLYKHSFNWSERSDPLELVVTHLYDAPSLSVLPSSTVASGSNVTFQCWSEEWFTKSVLYKDGKQINFTVVQSHGRGSQATFHLSAVTSDCGGPYQCYTFRGHILQEWSAPSDPLVLTVTGLPYSDFHPGNDQNLIAQARERTEAENPKRGTEESGPPLMGPDIREVLSPSQVLFPRITL
ncbi:leukocyte immunoglobulin-like receptor subfamily A member 3 [Macrotis lagotis]|uniref:leukocyte immunoglobulin-like receptor subfamily A member 3 n=1 Tax=Macrotis lagotis TaxID=92651 RepID=UPI003D69717F